MSSIKERIVAFKRGLLEEMLNECSEEQKKFFHTRVYPKGVPENRLDSALDLVDRTLRGNEENLTKN